MRTPSLLLLLVIAGSISLASGLAIGCASAPPIKVEGKPAASLAAAPSTPGEKCLALAETPRERQTNEPDKVGVRHVLVKYKGAKNAAESIARSREEACLRALEARDKVLGGADFDAVVSEYSDEAGAAGRRGSLGVLPRAEMVPAFADAAFELTVGQMSDVVETDFGFHLILRSE